MSRELLKILREIGLAVIRETIRVLSEKAAKDRTPSRKK